ncbi:Rho GTPase activating protein 39 [Sparganum proliferum]
MMHRQKSSRSDGLTSRNSLLMGEPKQAVGWQSASRPLPRQTPPQSAVPATSSQPPPPPPPHQRSPKDFEVHRRRNSQPSRSSGQQQQQHHHHPHHHSLTRNSLSGRSCLTPSSLGVANQRVTEWLRTAGALPEEAEFESLDMSAAVDAAGDPSACPRPQNVPDMARWSRNSGLSAGPATAAPHYPTVTHSSAFALQSPSSSGPPTGGAVTYDRRMRPAVPVHAAPKGQTVRLPEAPDLRDNFFSGGGGDAFSNLLYDTGCNVVYPRPPETQMDSLATAAFGSAGTEQVEQALSGLHFGRSPALSACQRTPQPSTRNRNIPRTNPAFVGSSGQTSNFTMPRLSAGAGAVVPGGGAWAAGNNRLSQQAPVGSHLPTFAEFGTAAPLQRTDQLNGLHKSARDKGFSNGFQADATPSSPDTELTNESASETDSDQEMGDFGGAVLRDQQSELLCASRDDDLFESHARFSPVVDEYTFTVDRTADLVGVGGPSDPPPPVPPPRTASAEASVRSAPPPHSPIGAPSANRQSNLADESTTWQSFASPTMGFLPRGHPFRQPTFRSTKQPGSADGEEKK